MASPISKTEYETLATFRYALRQFMRFSETAAREAGITPKQHQALLAIAGFPNRDQIMMSELAERLQVRHHTTVELIDRLAAQDLVVREPGMEDRRQVVDLLLIGEYPRFRGDAGGVHRVDHRRRTGVGRGDADSRPQVPSQRSLHGFGQVSRDRTQPLQHAVPQRAHRWQAPGTAGAGIPIVPYAALAAA